MNKVQHEMELSAAIKAELMEEMRSRNFNQVEIANFIGVSPSLISAILMDKKPATESLRLKMKEAKRKESENRPPSVAPQHNVNEPGKTHEFVEFEGSDWGTDWKLRVPVFEDDAMNTRALKQAEGLLAAKARINTDPSRNSEGRQKYGFSSKTTSLAERTLEQGMRNALDKKEGKPAVDCNAPGKSKDAS